MATLRTCSKCYPTKDSRQPLHFHTHSRLYQLKTTLNLFGFLVPFRQPLPINQSWQVRENPFVILSKSPQGTSVLGIL